MKKIIVILAAAALMLALSAPALAAEEAPQINYVPSATYEVIEADTEDGIHLEIREADPATVNEENLIETAEKSDKLKENEEISGYDVLEIVMVRDSTGEVIEWRDPITVVITFDKTADIVDVFVQNDEGTWDEASYSLGDDTITLNLPHLSNVAFSYKRPIAEPAQPTPGPNGGKKDNTVRSPQTGYAIMLWSSLSVLMAVCASACLLLARGKKIQ